MKPSLLFVGVPEAERKGAAARYWKDIFFTNTLFLESELVKSQLTCQSYLYT